MSCPNCGAQLEVFNQRFCQDCGKKIPDSSKSSELSQRSSPSPEDRTFQQIQQKSGKPSGPRPLSKRSLGFGIVSLIMAIFSFNVGSSLIMEPIIFIYFSGRNIFIALGVVNIIGIVFGIVSTTQNRKAKNFEPINKAMKAGSALGTLGLTLNIILTIVTFSFAIIFI